MARKTYRISQEGNPMIKDNVKISVMLKLKEKDEQIAALRLERDAAYAKLEKLTSYMGTIVKAQEIIKERKQFIDNLIDFATKYGSDGTKTNMWAADALISFLRGECKHYSVVSPDGIKCRLCNHKSTYDNQS